jgi:hypothetical protein
VSVPRPDLRSTAVKRVKDKRTMSFEISSVMDFVHGKVEIFAGGQVENIMNG